jgi:HD-like signal output (HDOD) protein
MSSWIGRFSALFGSGNTDSRAASVPQPVARAASVAHFVAPAPARAPALPPHGSQSVDTSLPCFQWLLGSESLLDGPISSAEQRLIVHLDTVLASDASRATLLPRATAVIPQLLSCLRDQASSVDALAARVVKDPHLVAEVIRMANSAHARTGTGAPVSDLPRAIGRIGVDGLRRVIAKVVLKPMLAAGADALSAAAAPRLWVHSEAQADECMRLCRLADIAPFEGYLAGLMHNIGWTAALRAMGRTIDPLPSQFSNAFAQAFDQRREAFFAMLVMPWQLTDSLTALAAEMLDHPEDQTQSPLGAALRQADQYASLLMIDAQTAQVPADEVLA